MEESFIRKEVGKSSWLFRIFADMKQRYLWHVAFWLFYSLIYAYLSTAFPAPSDLEYSWGMRYWRFWQSQLIMLPIKILTTYAFLYWIVPRFILKGDYLRAVLSGLMVLILMSVISRVMTYYVVYPYLYQEFPNYEMISVRRVLYSLLDIASAVTIAATLSLLRRRLDAQRREEELQREKLQSELNFLRAQTNPHFLFNTLNNIYALARKQSEQTAPVVLQLSQLLRFMLYECSEPHIPISREVKVIQDYIELEQLRYNERLQVSFAEDLDDPATMISPLLILPLVENAFKYGVSETRFDASVNISIQLHQRKLSVHIDNAQAEEGQQDREGLGLTGVQRQLDLIYPDKHQLRIQQKSGRHILDLEIDLGIKHSI